jgi:glycyl-tRNA synthetase beta subunit
MLPFLLEIGTEEIPDWMIPSALEFLRSKFPGENVRVDGTGRRLVLRADVAARSADREEVVTGPPASVTGKALDGLFLVIGEEEKKLRKDPLGAGNALLKKVFGG